MQKPSSWAVSGLVAGVCVLGGCDKEPSVTQYRQEKETPPAAAMSTTRATAAAPGMPAMHPPVGQSAAATTATEQQGELKFATPEGWRVDPTPRQFREATLLMGEGPASAELAVSKLGANFGDYAANINRWRAQLGLEPLADPSAVHPEPFKTPVGEAQLISLESPQKMTLVAILKQEDSTWFFKLTGDKQTVTQNRTKFEQLLRSIELH